MTIEYGSEVHEDCITADAYNLVCEQRFLYKAQLKIAMEVMESVEHYEGCVCTVCGPIRKALAKINAL